MSSSTWRVLSGYATYQRTPMRMISGGKWAPLKLIAIVALPHDALLVMEGEHTPNGLKCKFATEPFVLLDPDAQKALMEGAYADPLQGVHERLEGVREVQVVIDLVDGLLARHAVLEVERADTRVLSQSCFFESLG